MLTDSSRVSHGENVLKACKRLPSLPLSLLLLLLLLSLHPPGCQGQWPICYDYYVSDLAQCPRRDGQTGELLVGKGSYETCFHSHPWDVTSPPPSCRNEGCQAVSTSQPYSDPSLACCCGADQGYQQANPSSSTDEAGCVLTPSEAASSGKALCSLCGGARWGSYNETGGSAGRCPACQQGLGGSDGAGGKITEVYGNPQLKVAGQLDPQTFGHVPSLDYKLPLCSSDVRASFASFEEKVNVACDVQSLYELRKCGDCWIAICNFHNDLHWLTYTEATCAMDYFMRKMSCFASWYHKWCTCQAYTGIPYSKSSSSWETECLASPLFQFQARRQDSTQTGTWAICSEATGGRGRKTMEWVLTAALISLCTFKTITKNS